jgi:hypothetical protein
MKVVLLDLNVRALHLANNSPASALARTLCGNRVNSGAVQEDLAVPDHYSTVADSNVALQLWAEEAPAASTARALAGRRMLLKEDSHSLAAAIIKLVSMGCSDIVTCVEHARRAGLEEHRHSCSCCKTQSTESEMLDKGQEAKADANIPAMCSKGKDSGENLLQLLCEQSNERA